MKTPIGIAGRDCAPRRGTTIAVEELRVSNEELEEQGRALRESQARLELQQTELEQTNTQLEEHASLLEAQTADLTRGKALLEAQKQELERSSRYKSEFLANMSHELRTPLNSSLILLKLLADNKQGNLTPEQVMYANTIYGLAMTCELDQRHLGSGQD